MMDKVNISLGWVLVLFYLVMQSTYKNWSAILSFLVIFAATYYLKMDLVTALLYSFLISFTCGLFPRGMSTMSESFDNHVPVVPEEESVGGSTTTADGDSFIDVGKTFLQAYKSLTPGQIETMTADTKDLISTQKSLLETIKTLAPIVSEGKKMLDTFKDYFGDHKAVMGQLQGVTAAP